MRSNKITREDLKNSYFQILAYDPEPCKTLCTQITISNNSVYSVFQIYKHNAIHPGEGQCIFETPYLDKAIEMYNNLF